MWRVHYFLNDECEESRYSSLLEKIRWTKKIIILEFYRELQDFVANQNIANEDIIYEQGDEN